MSSKPHDFIEHYVNQVISEECVIELQALSMDYAKKINAIEEHQRHRDGAAFEMRKHLNKQVPDLGRQQLKQLRKDYIDKATAIAKKHAEKEGIPFIEWKESELTKSVAQQSQETNENLKKTQENMQQQKGKGLAPTFKEVTASEANEEKEDFKAIERAKIIEEQKKKWPSKEIAETKTHDKELYPKQDSLTKEEQKKLLVDQMKSQYSVKMSVTFNQQSNSQTDTIEALSKEEKRQRLIDEMKQQGLEMTKSREREI